MPELPEVEVVRSGLASAVSGATVTGVTVLDERSLRRHLGPAEDFVDSLTGAVFAPPSRRGKFLWIPLLPSLPDLPLSQMQELVARSAVVAGVSNAKVADSPAFVTIAGGIPTQALVIHLGMSGQVLLREPDADDRLTRIRIDLAHPKLGALRLNFVDQRIFGSMAIEPLMDADDLVGEAKGERIPASVTHIARDPLDPHFAEARFFAALKRRRTGIKRAILDQTLISGVGNIYADEALWAARIHYAQQTDALTSQRAKRLLTEIRAVLERSLVEGGTSFDSQYVNVNGRSGYFSHSLNAYGRQGLPCPRCGRPIVREQFMNRGSHFCPRCQRVR